MTDRWCRWCGGVLDGEDLATTFSMLCRSCFVDVIGFFRELLPVEQAAVTVATQRLVDAVMKTDME